MALVMRLNLPQIDTHGSKLVGAQSRLYVYQAAAGNHQVAQPGGRHLDKLLVRNGKDGRFGWRQAIQIAELHAVFSFCVGGITYWIVHEDLNTEASQLFNDV